MNGVVDTHVHVFTGIFGKWVPNLSRGPFSKVFAEEPIQNLKRQARNWTKPVSGSIHHVQTLLRYLPQSVRVQLDPLAGTVPLPRLLIESTPLDLKEAMLEAQVDYAWLIAHPPFISNETVMELCADNSNWIPIVNIHKKTPKPGQALRRYAEKGARALKIHAAADGEGPDSPRYRALIRAASDLGLPVILHTGCMNCRPFCQDPSQGLAERFSKWYETYSKTQFILAHMNFHDPNTALDLCEEFPNLWVDTSWQPTEIIGEAVRRMGADRVLFGSDWPFVGNNMMVGRKRVQDGVESGLLNVEQAKLILGENAMKLLGMSINAD